MCVKTYSYNGKVTYCFPIPVSLFSLKGFYLCPTVCSVNPTVCSSDRTVNLAYSLHFSSSWHTSSLLRLFVLWSNCTRTGTPADVDPFQQHQWEQTVKLLLHSDPFNCPSPVVLEPLTHCEHISSLVLPKLHSAGFFPLTLPDSVCKSSKI